MERRKLLANITSVGAIGFAGCVGGDGDDGGGNTESTETGEQYNKYDYYTLPKCDGSRPIQLTSVSGGTGMIRNMTNKDKIVVVQHGKHFADGSYCSGHLLGGGEQTGYSLSEHLSDDEPSEIEIAAMPDTRENRNALCSTINAIEPYNDGCVNPDTFQG